LQEIRFACKIRGVKEEKIKHQPFVTTNRLRSMGQFILLSGLVGIVAGIGAVVFQLLSHIVIKHTLELVAGYNPSVPLGEWNMFKHIQPAFGAFVPWLILVIITVGGLISGVIVYSLAPEAEGHGTDAAIKAYHHGRGLIRLRVPFVKTICSAITIGTGGSGGREGPIAQIGAGFGSFLGKVLKLSESQRRILLAAGLGAGIAAIFKAPLAGAIFAIEVLYRDEDFEAEALIPAFISCTLAYCTYGLFARYISGTMSGFEPLFSVHSGLKFNNPVLLVPLTVLAVFMAASSLLYVRCFYGVQGMFGKLRIPRHFKPAIGALAAGLTALVIFYLLLPLGRSVSENSLSTLSFGYGILQNLLLNQMQYGTVTLVVLLLAVGLGKILTTSLTISSGGSGGVFGPSMVIGGCLGGVVGLVLQHWMPSTITRIDVFVILGMAAFFSAAAKTPVSTIIMVSELTSGYELLLPAMWVSALAYILSHGWTIYHEQVSSRLDSPAHRGDFVIGVFDGLTIAKVWQPPARKIVTSPLDMPLEKILELIPKTTQTVFPVTSSEGKYQGLISLADVRQFLYEHQFGYAAIAQDLLIPDIEPLWPDTDLSVAMVQLAKMPYDALPVVDDKEHNSVIGIISRKDLLAAYNIRLTQMRPGKS
jgi:CIC family chloride channel protein